VNLRWSCWKTVVVELYALVDCATDNTSPDAPTSTINEEGDSSLPDEHIKFDSPSPLDNRWHERFEFCPDVGHPASPMASGSSVGTSIPTLLGGLLRKMRNTLYDSNGDVEIGMTVENGIEIYASNDVEEDEDRWG
jgi:hypothetical protein